MSANVEETGLAYQFALTGKLVCRKDIHIAKQLAHHTSIVDFNHDDLLHRSGKRIIGKGARYMDPWNIPPPSNCATRSLWQITQNFHSQTASADHRKRHSPGATRALEPPFGGTTKHMICSDSTSQHENIAQYYCLDYLEKV